MRNVMESSGKRVNNMVAGSKLPLVLALKLY